MPAVYIRSIHVIDGRTNIGFNMYKNNREKEIEESMQMKDDLRGLCVDLCIAAVASRPSFLGTSVAPRKLQLSPPVKTGPPSFPSIITESSSTNPRYPQNLPTHPTKWARNKQHLPTS